MEDYISPIHTFREFSFDEISRVVEPGEFGIFGKMFTGNMVPYGGFNCYVPPMLLKLIETTYFAKLISEALAVSKKMGMHFITDNSVVVSGGTITIGTLAHDNTLKDLLMHHYGNNDGFYNYTLYRKDGSTASVKVLNGIERIRYVSDDVTTYQGIARCYHNDTDLWICEALVINKDKSLITEI